MLGAMASWGDVRRAEPAFADRVQQIFDRHKHKIIATLRADGAPRVSGIEAVFDEEQLTFGSMPGARKGADLHRDPRFALHSAGVDVPEQQADWTGDAKVSGRAVPAGPVTEGVGGESFRVEVNEVVITRLNDEATRLVIESWRPDGGLRTVERD